MNRISRRNFLRNSIYAGGTSLALTGLPLITSKVFAQSSITGSNWMEGILPTYGNRTLRQLCMLGSHDAGMNVLSGGTAFSNACNTRTQTLGILEQLQAGVRYFDIRPVISGGQYYTGHYSKETVGFITSWQGSNGQSIQSIINDINTFTTSSNELILLNFSHDLDTDLGNSSYAPFTQDQWNALFNLLSGNTVSQGINYLYTLGSAYPSQDDLTNYSLNRFLVEPYGQPAPAVVVLITPSAAGINLEDGFYTTSDASLSGPPASDFPIYNEYSDTNNLNSMISDQMAKMRTYRASPQSSFFLLSWTLTQDSSEAVECATIGIGTTILDLANTANAQLGSILSSCSASCFPNVIYVDNVQASLNLSNLALQVIELN